MASQGESCDEWESEACQQGGAGTLRSMAGAWEKAGVEIRSRRGLSFALLFPYSLFPGAERRRNALLSPWGMGLPVCQGIAAGLLIAGRGASWGALASGMKDISTPRGGRGAGGERHSGHHCGGEEFSPVSGESALDPG